jgi:coenzyme F420 biosynthesis associated uncharacterized protein
VSRRAFVDWDLAERIATGLAGGGAPGPFSQSAVDSAGADALTLVLDYTRLRPASALPRPELVDRSEWTRVGMRTLRELSEQLEERLSEGLRLPGPLGSLARSLAGAATGAEAGVAVGYGARRVLGQYDVALVGPDREPRLLFVGENLASAHAELGGDPERFLRWIAIHETTHAVQFASVEWLRRHVAELVMRLIAGASARLDARSLRRLAGRLLRADPRAVVRTVLRGDVARLLAGPEQAGILDQLQAAMSVIEGHAEHVMDAAAEGEGPGYGRLRERLEAHRSRRGGLGEAIARLLGMELKLRQYRLGKTFCDGVVREGGVAALNEVWRAPDALPSTIELTCPERWLARVTAPAPV